MWANKSDGRMFLMESSPCRDVGTHTRVKLVTRIVLCGVMALCGILNGGVTQKSVAWIIITTTETCDFFRVMCACQCGTKYSDENWI